jgi:hypothetical protein
MDLLHFDQTPDKTMDCVDDDDDISDANYANRVDGDISEYFWEFLEAFRYKDIADIMDMYAYVLISSLTSSGMPVRIHPRILDIPEYLIPADLTDDNGYLVYDDVCSMFSNIYEIYDGAGMYDQSSLILTALNRMSSHCEAMADVESICGAGMDM